MAGMRDSHYIYAVSRIRAIENSLLGQSGMERLIDTQTPEQAMKLLKEAGYGHPSTETPAPAGYEKLLREEHKKLFVLLHEIFPESGIIDIFQQPYDFHNIKAILKAEFARVEADSSVLSDKGSIPVEKLKAILRDRQFGDLPASVAEAAVEALADLNHTRDPQTADLILDRACYRRMRDMADDTGSRFLTGFIAGSIDLLNMQIFIRLKNLGKGREFMERTILPGGYIKTELFLDITKDPINKLKEVLWDTPYRDSASRVVKRYETYGRKAFLEKLSDGFILAHILIGRQKISGLEPLIGYMLNRESELRNVRTVLSGKMNGVSPEKIRERLRAVYV
jgi:V/A-type H+-transporting ATPase subunit C